MDAAGWHRRSSIPNPANGHTCLGLSFPATAMPRTAAPADRGLPAQVHRERQWHECEHMALIRYGTHDGKAAATACGRGGIRQVNSDGNNNQNTAHALAGTSWEMKNLSVLVAPVL